ncbi:MAG: helix-turn-helix domain-containing protein [Chloracidobacterium sp.]|nr:helix-turn-helix domain-containing protein [Chloracidobacterium sp.]
MLLADDKRITVKELPPEVVYKLEKSNVSVSYSASGQNGVSAFSNVSPTKLRESERQQILSALEKTGWHRGKTAELLGISPSTLYRRLRDYNLEVR